MRDLSDDAGKFVLPKLVGKKTASAADSFLTLTTLIMS